MANLSRYPDELKEMVVEQMSFEGRACVKRLSPFFGELVEATESKYEYAGLTINVEKKKECTTFSINLQMETNQQFDFSVNMYAHTSTHNSGQVVVIRYPGTEKQNTKQIDCSSGEEGVMLINRYFNEIVGDSNLRFDRFEVNANYPNFLDGHEFVIHPKYVQIKVEQNQVVQWLERMAPGVEEVVLKVDGYDYDETIEGFGTIPAIMNANLLFIEYGSDINDEQRLNFNCTYMGNWDKSKITEKGFNQLIKKLIANDYPISTYFITHMLENPQVWEEINDGFDMEVTDFRDGFDENGEVRLAKIGRIDMNDNKQVEVTLVDNIVSLRIVSK